MFAMKTAIFLIVAIAALGAVGVTTAILSSAPAQASCQSDFGKDVCHGCSPNSFGDGRSDDKCQHP
jgi:hypothetical protein